jgi:limonene-1,2-epoxide hydrolase
MSIEQIVRAEMAAWGHNDVDEIISHFADYDLLKNFFAGGTCIELEILHLAMDGDVVLMERTDHWSIGGQKTSWPVMGAYEVHGDKITAWREYYFPPSAPSESEG